jgi:hypothetical protein
VPDGGLSSVCSRGAMVGKLVSERLLL